MHKYQVTEGHIVLRAGRVLLSPEQHRVRAHNLTGVDGVCEIAAPIHFKAGEVFSYDGDLGKHMSKFVIELTETFRTAAIPVDHIMEDVRPSMARKARK